MAGIDISSVKFNVMKFDGSSNFGLWQRRVKDLLVQQGIVKVLYEMKPNGIAVIDWKELEAKAVATNRLCLGDDMMYHIMDEESLAAVWLKLKSRYMSKSLTNKLYLKQRLYGLKMAEGSNLSQHINMFNQIIDDLKKVDVKFEDEDEALMLLNSLPTYSMYENLVTTLTWGKETLELEDVIGALLAFHQRKKNIDENFQREELVVKGNYEHGRNSNKDDSKGKNSWSKSRRRKDINCYKCGKKGHVKQDCPDRKKNKDDENEGSSKSANIVEDNSNDDNGDMLSVASNSEHLVDSWILDSTCLFYVTPNRDWFDTYRSINSNIVTMGNDAHCKITGIGNIRIKMFDSVVKTLCEVRHIPEVKKNLISLGILDSNGYGYKSESRVMKVTKGAMVVMKGQKSSKNIYKLLGNTVVGGIASVESDSDCTILWHMQLGHMSERGMLELHKRNLLKGVKTYKLDLCKFYVLGKQNRVQFKTATHKTEGILYYVHSDVWGPVKTASQGRHMYFVIFIDDFSRKVPVHFMWHKSETFAKFKLWKAEVKN
jgi:hypothetical protein